MEKGRYRETCRERENEKGQEVERERGKHSPAELNREGEGKLESGEKQGERATVQPRNLLDVDKDVWRHPESLNEHFSFCCKIHSTFTIACF